MKLVLLDQPVDYDGRQLATAFVDRWAPNVDDALILFTGVADVPPENMVDLEDAEAGAGIYSPRMAHAIVEHRGIELTEAVCRQRLLMRLAAEWVGARSGVPVAVRGDDLFVGPGKLSVSIATRSPRSCLIHAGFNVETEGTPVVTAGLADLRLRASDFLRGLGRLYADEVGSVERAVKKVRPVA